jgi:cyclopropane fatty-acyl-phospholipid synthase-like methyltransferase
LLTLSIFIQFVWPNNGAFASWLAEHSKELIPGKRILELGTGTGVLYVWLQKRFSAVAQALVCSDAADAEISSNVCYNCEKNSVRCDFVAHTWGTKWSGGEFDVLVASDILLYVKAYPALVETLLQILAPRETHSLCHLRAPVMRASGPEETDLALRTPFFLLSARRRVADDHLFFEQLRAAGFEVLELPQRLHIICLPKT